MLTTDWIIASIFPSTLCDWSIISAIRVELVAVRELDHDPEELERVDRADDEVVVRVLAVVEVEAAEQVLGEQASDDLLDVGALRVMAGVDEHAGLRAEASAEEGRGAPVGQVCGVEGGLEELVLDEQGHLRVEEGVRLLEPRDEAVVPALGGRLDPRSSCRRRATG